MYPSDIASSVFRIQFNVTDSINRTYQKYSNWTVAPTSIALNTSRPMYNVGNYVGKDIYFIGTPPAGSSFSATFRHSEGCKSGTLTTQNNTYSWGLTNICSGTVWLNVTTTDQYSRCRLDVYSYIIDAEVTSTPIFSLQGASIQNQTMTILGPSTTIALSNIVDSGGIGPDRAECLTNGQTAHTSYQTSATIIPQSSNGNITNFTLRCRIVDQVGNIGPYTWMNASVDRVQPVVTLPNPHMTNSITPTSTITATSIDSVMNGTSRLNFTFNGQSTSWNSTVPSIPKTPHMHGAISLRLRKLREESFSLQLPAEYG